MTINLKSAFFGAQIAARQMIKQGSSGRIINISSVHEDWPMPGYPPYCLSQGGMRMLTRTAGVELASDKRRENLAKSRVLASRHDIDRRPRFGERCSRRRRMREARRGALLPPYGNELGATRARHLRPFRATGPDLELRGRHRKLESTSLRRRVTQIRSR